MRNNENGNEKSIVTSCNIEDTNNRKHPIFETRGPLKRLHASLFARFFRFHDESDVTVTVTVRSAEVYRTTTKNPPVALQKNGGSPTTIRLKRSHR